MSGISGIGTTFNLPNYHGELFQITPSDTPLLTAIGGLTGGGQVDSPKFEWSEYDLRNPKQPVTLEGANAPTAEERVRAKVENVCQIHQEKVEVSYTKQASIGQYANGNGGSSNAVTDELSWQTEQALKQMARDVDYSFINGIYKDAANNTEPRKTKGLIQAAATNKVNKGTALTDASAATDTITVTHALNNGDKVIFTDTGGLSTVVAGRVYYVVSKSTTASFKVAETSGGTAITLGTATVQMLVPSGTDTALTDIEDLIQMVYDNGGLANGLGTLLVNSTQKRKISALYAAAYAKAVPVMGNVGGVNVTQLETDFGVLNIMLDRWVPQDALVVCSLDQLRPVFLNIPGKGVFFEEALAKTGATDAVQIYGEVGLEFGNERAHGVLRGLKL